MSHFRHFLVVCSILSLISCKQKQTLFRAVSSEHSGIHFNNRIVENDSINPIDLTNIYNGGGVGIGDFNNDGLPDVYFTGNQVSNKLYLNKGDLKFEDVTAAAGVTGNGKWCRGVSVVDINNDGLQDIYVCATLVGGPQERTNLLYINQGVNKSGVPVFKEMASEYGLADTTHSTMAAFFDYDNDGDLDMYLTVNEILKGVNASTFRPIAKNGTFPSTGRLYRNDWNAALKHPVFTDVSKQTGITIEGYGHGVNIADFNKDGWKDIFVTNDFIANDILYINNHDGTFTDKASTYFKHTSANGMGQDVIDVNNDGLSDVVEVDMNPEDNYRKKMMLGANSYQVYQNSDYFGYEYQYVRNTLQVNQGPRLNGNDSIGDPVFSDVGYFAGIAETDWSWTPLVQDFDNNGLRDIIISNGFPKDVTDHDFIAFRNQSYAVAGKDYTLAQIPQVKLHNYAFQNKGNLRFDNATQAWGLATPSFSNGAAYADLDNDGDLDVIINNINDEAFVYQNTIMDGKNNREHYLTVKLEGDSLNRNGFGAWVEVYYDGKQQAYEQTPYRGYLSTVDVNPHFGLDTTAIVDSLVVKWPNGRKQVLQHVQTDRIVTLSIKNANENYSWSQPAVATNTLFTDVTNNVHLQYKDSARDVIDFNIQKLLPHKFTEYGPALAVGDVNGDGLDDMVVGSAVGVSPNLLLQQADGHFFQKPMLPGATPENKPWRDMGVVLLDVDGDKDLDAIIVSGGYEAGPNTTAYQDRLYLNDGKGNFKIDTAALPQNLTSKSCVRAADYDHDGDLDLFIAGRVMPWNYPKPVSSFIYRNDSKNGVVKFADVTDAIAPSLKNAGLVCDAVWSDYDGDGWPDLVLTGEWMPVTFLKNYKGVFKDATATSNISHKVGWWTSIVPGDFDNDGDVDYIVGNLGLNSFYRASDRYPVSIYAKDFNGDGNFDAIPTLYLPTSQEDTQRVEYPVHTRDDIIKQVITFRAKYKDYKSFATTPFPKMMTEDEMKGVLKLQANYFANSYIRNNGDGTFAMAPLPAETQYSCLNGMLAEDFDGDGNLDLLAVGNDYGTEVSVGRYDACNGLLLKGDGKGNFFKTPMLKSGWFVPGNAKALVKLKDAKGNCLVVASQNKGPLKAFAWKRHTTLVPVQPQETNAFVLFKDGRKQKRELYYGASFMSQSGRFLNVDSSVMSVEILDNKGNRRSVPVQ